MRHKNLSQLGLNPVFKESLPNLGLSKKKKVALYFIRGVTL